MQITLWIVLFGLAAVQWAAISLVRFVPTPIRNPAYRLAVIFCFGSVMVGITILEKIIYRGMASPLAPKGVFAFFLIFQTSISILILIKIVAKRRTL